MIQLKLYYRCEQQRGSTFFAQYVLWGKIKAFMSSCFLLKQASLLWKFLYICLVGGQVLLHNLCLNVPRSESHEYSVLTHTQIYRTKKAVGFYGTDNYGTCLISQSLNVSVLWWLTERIYSNFHEKTYFTHTMHNYHVLLLYTSWEVVSSQFIPPLFFQS